ncbi:hypothetical protein CMQ_5385 [Grosmannia clavigera kw1407]|uniref:Cell wall protein n=1 Tax=Grosmannia clavigera (strain kw1407 / UAMH 11150) TaxID=655863 RepID=F0XB97_GROCL|nr:uncharacterized protein CMQ_5385 [Grosmannia clavigera kw1407]EFX05123.1 hypothetical protein CMQ_5385 [Grosmannia clavigera kw1407]
MKYGSAAVLFAGMSLASAASLPTERTLKAREVPQEHSHNRFLDLVRTSLSTNNPKGISDPVFGLLGNAAAAGGAGKVTNLDCLQQETADQAFTNAKTAGDIPGMAGALLYRSIERNTGAVGKASVICNETATNPEIAAVSQHQDPASSGAAATNKAIVLALAKQLAAIGADPLLALESGTFAPGSLSDTTAKGNSCDTEADEPGCIFTQNLLVLDASEAEISAAVAGIKPTKFTGTLGAAAPAIESSASSRPFTVNGNTFVNLAAAVQRSCDVQRNACFNAANSGKLTGGTAQCDTQATACSAANSASAKMLRRASDFGTCSTPTILFKSGLDGRTTDAFIASDQTDFNHGSALNIAVIAGFICQRLQSSCNAAANVVSSCTSASAAAVATTQNQAAADVFNSMIGAGSAAAATTTAAVVAAAATAAASQVLTITQCA